MQRFAVTEKIIPVSLLVYVHMQPRKNRLQRMSRINAGTLIIETHPIALFPSVQSSLSLISSIILYVIKIYK